MNEISPFQIERETIDRVALVSHRISARLSDTRSFTLRVGPQIARLRSRYRHSYSRSHCGGVRGRVTAFTEDSRRRMEVRFRESEWPQHRLLVFITLTWPRYFSADPADWKRALRAWRAAYERRWGPITAIWALEFQERGAPHFHLAIAGPRGVSIEQMRAWNAETWYRIAGHGDERHLRQHEKVGHCKKARSAQELLGYLQKELRKSRQKELPAWLKEREEGAGRWWGVWNLHNVAFDVALTRDEFDALHRVGRVVQRGPTAEAFTRGDRGRVPPSRRVKIIRGHRYVLKPLASPSKDPWTFGQRWVTRRRRTRSRWRPDSRWLLMRDQARVPWSLAQAMYNLKEFVNGDRRARSSYAEWDDGAAVQLRLQDDELRDLVT